MGWVDLVRDIQFANQVFSVPITVRVVDEVPIETRGIWLVPQSEAIPNGAEFTRSEPIRMMALRRDEVPTVPRGTLIEAPEKPDDDAVTWKVDGHERQEADHHRVIVIRQPDEA